MNFNVQGQEVLVEYSYPWLPSKCLKCEKWGHSFKTCPNKREQGELQDENNVVQAKEVLEEEEKVMESSKLVETNVVILEVTQTETTDTRNEEEKALESSEVVETKDADTDKTEREWLDVTPGKTSRSQNTRVNDLKFGILTNSRFAVLSSEEEEEGEIVEQEKENMRVQKVDQQGSLEELKEKDNCGNRNSHRQF
ncbi:hypothetical protein Bca52824_025174 [Brassica carinata]|uniref:CCHC-type domain-containing protein n=1 Tax=Brassica carinata TaxID=52824 RepID=A0A8X8AXJ6_BRACI|nr:hypothetical protein Bca52824_025174 [Brassica carinata]